MARPRKPTEVLKLTGAFRKDPQRRAARSSEPSGGSPVGEPPEYFGDDLIDLWRELVGISPAGVLTQADRWTVEVACRMMRMLRSGIFGAAEVNTLIRCLSQMGMTPADRSKIVIPKQVEAQDEIAALAAESIGSLRTRPN